MANTEPTDTKPLTVNEPSKKKYSPPIFTQYGTVREMTKTVGPNNLPDGGTLSSHTKTAI